MSSYQNSGKVGKSDLNARPEIRSAFPRTQVRFYETTLRDGQQSVRVVLSRNRKWKSPASWTNWESADLKPVSRKFLPKMGTRSP
jgi:hypothetical protein